MGMQHALHYGHLPPEFAAANALGVNVPVPLDPSQRLPPEQLAHHLDARSAHAGAHRLWVAMLDDAWRVCSCPFQVQPVPALEAGGAPPGCPQCSSGCCLAYSAWHIRVKACGSKCDVILQG